MRILLVCALLVCSVNAFAKSSATVTNGLASISNGNLAAARDAAVQDALKQAIAQVAGQWIESKFSDRQAETTRNQETTFLSQVEAQTSSETKGFVETYKIVSESHDQEAYRVQVAATINTAKLTDLFAALADALQKRGTALRVVVAARERQDGKTVLTPLAGPYVQGALTKAGLMVVNEPSDFASAQASTAAATALGKKLGADVVVLVDADYKDLGVIAPGAELEALVGQTRVEVKIGLSSVLVAAGRVLSSRPVSMTSIGINYDRALARALNGRGKNAITQVTDDFCEKLLQALQDLPKSSSMQVTIERVQSFKNQGRGLIALLEKIVGVRKVDQKSYAGDRLELSVDFAGSEVELERAVFDACAGASVCKTIDKKASSQAGVTFVL